MGQGVGVNLKISSCHMMENLGVMVQNVMLRVWSRNHYGNHDSEKCGYLHLLTITNRFCVNNTYNFSNNCMLSTARWVPFNTQVNNEKPIRAN